MTVRPALQEGSDRSPANKSRSCECRCDERRRHSFELQPDRVESHFVECYATFARPREQQSLTVPRYCGVRIRDRAVDRWPKIHCGLPLPALPKADVKVILTTSSLAVRREEKKAL